MATAIDLSTVLAGAAKGLASALAKRFIATLEVQVKGNHANSAQTLTPRIESHLDYVIGWSERIEFFGLGHALETDSATVALGVSTTPRHFSALTRSDDWDEAALLASNRHILLLGDPGAGKSTTLKRLCRLVLREQVDPADCVQFPIVLRLRLLPLTKSLYEWIADALGLQYETKFDQSHEVRSAAEGTAARSLQKQMVGDRELDSVIGDLLDETAPLLCIDGLDEIPTERRLKLEQELSQLATRLRRAKVIATMRSGAHLRNQESFDAVELLPLTGPQIEDIASKALGDADAFLEAIKQIPNQDALRRPIALTQLIALYKVRGTLPDQPSVATKKLLALYLEEWDFQNRVNRESRYACLTPERKADFLAAAAFHLTFRIGASNFSRHTLERVYQDIHASFGLPEAEAAKVAEEIETHTGIIVRVGPDHHEFCHLSIQEYLAASYLVRNPFSPEVFDCLAKQPAPTAISVVLASDSVNWLSHIILHSQTQHRLPELADSIVEFLRRLILERPFFYQSGLLGYTLLSIAFEFVERDDVNELLQKLLMQDAVRKSLLGALKAYTVRAASTDTEAVAWALRRSPQLSDSLFAPRFGRLSRGLITEEEMAALIGA